MFQDERINFLQVFKAYLQQVLVSYQQASMENDRNDFLFILQDLLRLLAVMTYDSVLCQAIANADIENANALIAYAPADDKGWSVKREGVETLLCCLSPFAPHITEELWHMLGNDSFLSVHKWFEVDESALVEDSVTIVLQINGKVREQFTVPAGLSKDDLLAEVMGREETKKRVEGKEIVKTIAVPGKLVNIVVKG